MLDPRPYVGRFAPSPTGLLHAGSLVAALASWLDARAHGGRWLVRIEDVDTPRCVPGAAAALVAQLHALGLVPDEPPAYQSARGTLYQQALDMLLESGWAYPCACSRRDILLALATGGRTPPRHRELVYPGTCRPSTGGLCGRPARAVRMLTVDVRSGAPVTIEWQDRRLGAQMQRLDEAVGDFVLRRADGLWAYQLAVVVDDAAQGVTDVVRGEDLADNTPRQIHLQRALGLPTPRYLHTPLVRDRQGEKLSKQTGAQPLDTRNPIAALQAAGRVLGLNGLDGRSCEAWLTAATAAWRAQWVAAPRP